MLESKPFKRLGHGGRQRADNGGQRIEGRGAEEAEGSNMAAEEAEGSREQNRQATHENTHTHQRAESGWQRAKCMHWAQGKLPECNKWQQITQEGTEPHQMS